MGIYINPREETKEEFLEKYGSLMTQRDVEVFEYRAETHKEHTMICLVDNGIFTAAGVVFNEREREAFSRLEDGRPKKWYLVPINVLNRGGLTKSEIKMVENRGL